MTDDKMIEKVRKLLAMAEGAKTAHEAEAFTAKATQLMVDYSIDEAKLQRAGEKTNESIVARDFVLEGYAKAKMMMLSGIATAMGCKAVYTPNTRRSGWTTVGVTVIGWESDVTSIQVLFSSLLMQMTSDMEREAKRNKNVHGRAFKQAFILGFAATVTRRLTAQRASAVKTAEDAAPGTGLAVVERFTAVEQDFRRRYPSTSKGTAAKASSGAGYNNGVSAGQRAALGQASLKGGRKAIDR